MNKNYEDVFNNAGIGIIIIDPQETILDANQAFINILGYQKKELLKITVNAIIHPHDLASHQELFKELVSGKRNSYQVDQRYIRKDGQIIWVKLRATVIHDNFKKVKHLVGIVEDITSQKAIEKKTASEQYLLKNFIENMPDNIYFKDLNSKFIKANLATALKLGFNTADELLGKSDFDIFDEENAAGAFRDEQEIIKSGKPHIGTEKKEIWKNGKITWAISTKMPLHDESGNIIGTFGFTRDITEKIKAEKVREALFQISEVAYTASDMDTLYKKIHDVIVTLMPVKNLYIAKYEEILNTISFPYFVNESVLLQEPQNQEIELTKYVLQKGEAILLDEKKYLELRKNGEVIIDGNSPAVWLGVPLKLSGKTIGAIVVNDYKDETAFGVEELQLLTFVAGQIAQAIERKQSSEAIQKYAEELKQLNNTKDKFFSIIAHDLKSPFITILGFSDVLKSDFNELSDEEKLFYIDEMKKSAEVSHNLLQNLLQWSRSQTGRIEFSPQKLELQKIVEGNILLLQATAQKKEIGLQHGISEKLHVFADEDMLNTVLRNLITNAVKFSNKNGIIKITAEEKDNYIEIGVADNGVGMDQKTIDSLFRLDITHSTSGTDNESGTGLGLILCKEFIERNGGEIRVDSEVDKGSKFIFTLPIP